MSIKRLQQKYLMPHDFRKEASRALSHLLDKPKSQRAVIALPPSGLMGGYLAVIKKTHGLKVVLQDKPDRILERIVFYDVDSRPMNKHLTNEERPLYLKEIKKDITYFKKSYTRADLQVSIEDMDVEQAAHHILAQLTAFRS
jgi:shikimate kinase